MRRLLCAAVMAAACWVSAEDLPVVVFWKFDAADPYPPNDPNASIANVACKKFPGAIDELRMYRRKLSEAEIRYLYEHPVPSGLLGPVRIVFQH